MEESPMPKQLDFFTQYFCRTETLHWRIHRLVSQHRKWLTARTKGRASVVYDIRFLDQVLIELAAIMRAVETGHVDAIDKAEREAAEKIIAFRKPAKPIRVPTDSETEA
jgi:hypothetical protein